VHRSKDRSDRLAAHTMTFHLLAAVAKQWLITTAATNSTEKFAQDACASE
jgi:hypothetical protein